MLKILFWLLLALNAALFALWQNASDGHAQRSEPQRLARQLHPEQLILKAPVAAAVKPAASSMPESAPTAATDPPQSAVASGPTATPATAAATVNTAVTVATAKAIPAAPTPTIAAASAPSPASAVVPPAMPTPAPLVTPKAQVAAIPEKLLACVEIGNFDPNEARSFRGRLAAAKLHASAAQHSVREVASYMVYIAAEDGREGAARRTAELRRLGLTDFYVLPESSPMHDAVSLGLFKTEAAAKAYIGQLIPKGVRSARIAERTASTNKVAFRLRDLNGADQAAFAALVSAFPNQSRRDCSG